MSSNDLKMIKWGGGCPQIGFLKNTPQFCPVFFNYLNPYIQFLSVSLHSILLCIHTFNTSLYPYIQYLSVSMNFNTLYPCIPLYPSCIYNFESLYFITYPCFHYFCIHHVFITLYLCYHQRCIHVFHSNLSLYFVTLYPCIDQLCIVGDLKNYFNEANNMFEL